MDNILIFSFVVLLHAPVCISVDKQYVDQISSDLHILWKVESNTKYFSKNKVQLTLKNTGLQKLVGKDWEIYFDTPMMVEPDFLPDSEANLGDQGVQVRHWKGTHYIISPTDKFIDLMPGTERNLQLNLGFWTVSRTDSFPNWYIKFTGFDPNVIQNTAVESLDYVAKLDTPKQWKRATTDKLNPFTAQERYRRYHNNYKTNDTETRISIIPKPVFIKVILGGGDVTVDSSWLIEYATNMTSEANYLKVEVGINLTKAQPAEKVIRLKIGDVIHPVTNENLEKDEAYKLEVNAGTKQIEITGKTKTGVFNGIQSFLSLFAMGGVISTMTIVDQPRFQYRGMHIDVGRNFHSKFSILKLLDAMAMVKLNKLHFHLSDDEGWRLEIPGLPELTGIGAKRCYDTNECLLPQLGSGPYTPNAGSGYYSVDDYQEILRYASTRHIQVIPEFDMPGHARAAIKAMEKRYTNAVQQGRTVDAEEYLLHDPSDVSKYWSVQYFDDNAVSPCMNSTYKFLGHVIDEVIKLHKNIQPLEMYHFGGDEVGKGAWVNSSKCQELNPGEPVVSDDIKERFFKQVADLTGKRKLNMAAWEDGMMRAGKPFNITGLTSKDLYAYIWNNIWEWGGATHAYNLANAGYKVIMCQATHLYFDHPYEPDPEERGYYWAPRFTDAKKTFSFMPDDVYQNIDFTRFGDPLDQKTFCKDEETCPTLTKPENIVGMQGHLWSETVRTPEELQYMIFPRILAIGERAWHKAGWESILDKTERDVQIDFDWARFSKSIGLRYLLRLERLGIKYRMSPPGGMVEHMKLMTNTEYNGQMVQYSDDNGVKWSVAGENTVLKSNNSVLLKTRNQDGSRESRIITLHPVEPLPVVDQSVIDQIAENLSIGYEVISNFDNNADTYLAKYTLTNIGHKPIPLGNWEIYFYSMEMVEPEHLKGHVPYELPGYDVIIQHVNGGLFRLTPTRKFGELKPGGVKNIQCRIRNWSVAKTDVMPNIYVTADGMNSKVLKSTAGEKLDWVKNFKRVEQWKRYKTDDIQDRFDPFTPNNRFSINDKVKDFGEAPETVIPTPLQYTVTKDKSISLPNADWVIVPDFKYTKEAEVLAEKLYEWGLPKLDIKQTEPSNKFISLVIGDPEVEQSEESSIKEAYSLNIEPSSQSIEIRSLGNAGVFYGVQSLLGIIKRSEGGVIYKTMVKDAPRFEYRGMHIDVGRNFHSNTSIMKILDVMAMVKLNKLHFHLTDDEGWRLEIPGLEELTKIGSKRCDDLSERTCIITQLGSGPDTSSSGSGHYTVEDYKEILKYAADRHIEIIPEVDMPGHAHSAIKSMVARSKNLKDIGDIANSNKFSLNDPEDTSDYTSIQLFHDNSINPCIESTYTFVLHVVQQLKALHKDINPLKTFHFGGDEVAEGSWLNSTACKKHEESKSVDALKEIFTKRISNLTNAEGLDLAGWEDGLKKTGNIPFDLNKLVNSKVYGYAWSNVWEWGAAPRAHILANKGYKVVMAPATHYYFDHPYEPDPLERGHYWAARYTDTKKVFGFMPNNLYANAELQVSGEPISKSDFCGDDGKECPDLEKPENLIGIQGNLWSETVRQQDQLEYMIFPRLLALAERAWHKAEWEDIEDKQSRNKARDADWERFSNNLGYAELKSLDKMNISYRVPPPGIKKDGEMIYANSEIPGLKIMLSEDGKDWKPVSREGMRVDGNLKFVTLSADEQRKSREISMESTIHHTSGSTSYQYQFTSISIIILCIITTIGI